MVRISFGLPDFLLFVLVLTLISPVPVTDGISTLRLIPVVVVLAIPVFLLRKRLLLDENILVFVLLYLLLVLLSFEAIMDDNNYRLMYLSTLVVAFALPLLRVFRLKPAVLAGVAILFAMLVLLNSGTLLTSAFLGGSRLDVLIWQKESAFVYGINKFLAGLFTVSVLFVITEIRKPYKLLIAFLYLFLSVFYGSRSHSLLSVGLLLLTATDSSLSVYRSTMRRWMNGVVIIGLAVLVVGYLIDYDVVVQRVRSLFVDFSSSNRWPTIEVFVGCLSNYAQLMGKDVLECTQEVTYDLDNSFAFVTASSGLAGLAVFCLLLFWSFRLLLKSRIDRMWVIYIFCSMLIILNVDIVVYRPIILLPVVVYMLRDMNVRERRVLA